LQSERLMGLFGWASSVAASASGSAHLRPSGPLSPEPVLPKDECIVPVARVNDINMYYEVHGRGEPLVLISGLGGASDMWWQQVEHFAPHYMVITFDARGTGRSDVPDIPYSMQMLVGDIAALLDRLSVGPAHLYGLSMGGMVAQEFTLCYPGRVISLVLGATSCGGSHSVFPPDGVMLLLAEIQQLPPRQAMQAAASLLFSQGFIDGQPTRVEELMIRSIQAPPSPLGFRRQMEATAGFDSYDRLPLVTVPALLIAGTEDRLLPAENTRILASRLPDVEVVLLEGLGHGYTWEAGEEADRAVLDFLRRHPAPAGGNGTGTVH